MTPEAKYHAIALIFGNAMGAAVYFGTPESARPAWHLIAPITIGLMATINYELVKRQPDLDFSKRLSLLIDGFLVAFGTVIPPAGLGFAFAKASLLVSNLNTINRPLPSSQTDNNQHRV